MNREIKFRVYNGYAMEHRVIVGKLGAFYCQGMDENDSACLSPFNTKYHDTTPIMQYTGLTDKNGVEIYEGDIVKHFDRDYLSSEVIFRYGAFGYIADKLNDYFISYCQNWHNFKGSMETMQLNEIEVIGDIYQNKNLIK